MTIIVFIIFMFFAVVTEDMLRKANERRYIYRFFAKAKEICNAVVNTYAFIYACVLCWTGNA